MTKRLEVSVHGRVQLVMFRDFVKRRARRLGLSGWVKNETNGTVSVVTEGEEHALRELLAHIEKGSLLSRVDSVEEKWSEAEGIGGIFIIKF